MYVIIDHLILVIIFHPKNGLNADNNLCVQKHSLRNNRYAETPPPG